jgi:alkane 1-monooxygenase
MIMDIRIFKYFSPFVLFTFSFLAFTHLGWFCWWAPLYTWVFIPLIEILFPPNPQKFRETSLEIKRNDRFFDGLLYMAVLALYFNFYYFLNSFRSSEVAPVDIMGRIFTMGLLLGVFGMNLGHELGHRFQKGNKMMAIFCLALAQYTHFYIEHNHGHHKNMGKFTDPGTARLGENLYSFYLRAILSGYFHAWTIAMGSSNDGKSKTRLFPILLGLQLFQVTLLIMVFIFGGWKIGLYYILSVFIGILLIETVNYIEHYGLSREISTTGQFEKIQAYHSWNSDHWIGRTMLFELTRHSDHHLKASKKYQNLQNYQNAPQLPTGYPGSMLLSLIPPAWFWIMHRKIKNFKEEKSIMA